MQLCCTLSETVCFEVIHPCITNFRFWYKSSSQRASQVEKASGFHVSLVIFTAVCRSLQILKPRSSNCRQQQQVLPQQLITESTFAVLDGKCNSSYCKRTSTRRA